MLDDFGKSLARVITLILQHLCNIAVTTFKRVAESPIVAKILPKSRHIRVLGLKNMLQTFTNTRPYPVEIDRL